MNFVDTYLRGVAYVADHNGRLRAVWPTSKSAGGNQDQKGTMRAATKVQNDVQIPSGSILVDSGHTLPKGAQVVVQQSQAAGQRGVFMGSGPGPWYRVRSMDGSVVGWVPQSSVQLGGASPKPQAPPKPHITPMSDKAKCLAKGGQWANKHCYPAGSQQGHPAGWISRSSYMPSAPRAPQGGYGGGYAPPSSGHAPLVAWVSTATQNGVPVIWNGQQWVPNQRAHPSYDPSQMPTSGYYGGASAPPGYADSSGYYGGAAQPAFDPNAIFQAAEAGTQAALDLFGQSDGYDPTQDMGSDDPCADPSQDPNMYVDPRG